MKLSGRELRQIREILVKSAQLQKTDDRRNFLNLCELEECLNSIQLDGVFVNFFNSLYTHLSGVTLSAKEGKSGFAIFLEYFLDLEELIEEGDKNFIELIVQKLNSGKSSTIPQKKNQTKEQLNRGRQTSTQQKQTRKTRIKIDKSEIIKFDLTQLESTLKERIIQYKGAFAFSVGSEQLLLENYILQRIECELKDHTQRPIEKFEFNLYSNTVNNHTSLENFFYSKYKKGLTNVLEHEKLTDIMLIVWNYNIPPESMQNLAQSFWKSVSQQVQPFVKKKKCCFVLIWANIGLANIDKTLLEEFTVLPIPEEVDWESLDAWFSSILTKKKVTKALINDALKRLKDQGGHLAGTFREMNQIIHELQGGYQLYG